MFKKLRVIGNRYHSYIPIIFLLSLFFVSNLKMYFLAYVVLVLIEYFLERDLLISVWTALVISLPFSLGKSFRVASFFIPVPAGIEMPPVNNFYFFVTMSDILIIFSLWLVLKNKDMFNQIRIYLGEICLFILATIGFISSYFSTFPFISFLFLIHVVISIIFYFIGRKVLYIFRARKVNERTKLILFSHIAFQGLLSVFQYIKKGFLTKFIEEAQFQHLGHFTAEHERFRSSGTFNHPNDLAAFLVVLLPLAFFELLRNDEQSEKKFFIIFSFVLGALGLVFTLSRGAWIVLGFNLILIGMITKKEKIKFNFEFKKFWLILFLVAFLVFPLVYNRASSLIGALRKDGSGLVRLDLNREAFYLLKDSPILGIGPGLFIPMLIQRHRTNIVYIFPSIVHNSFLHIGAEMGLVALILYIIFLTQGIKIAFINKNRMDLYTFWGCLLGIVNYVLLSFGYPLFKSWMQNVLFLLVVILVSGNKG